MVIGNRLRSLREQKKLSQGDIQKRTGLLRCYISRVENGFTTPSVETLEKMSQALGIPLYQLFYEGNGLPKPPKPIRKQSRGKSVKEGRLMATFHRLLRRANESDRKLLLHMARKMADHKSV